MTALFARIRSLLPVAGALAAAAGCSPEPVAGSPEVERAPAVRTEALTVRFVAFTTVRESYEKRIIPLFVEQWRRQRGQEIRFEQTYGASGDQAEAIAGGLAADVAALSNEEDVDRLVESGLVNADWRQGTHRGTVSRSVVVLAVRPGNPLGVRDWSDLARPGIGVVMPDPSSSGGARWGITAIYGSVLRGGPGRQPGSPAEAEQFLARVLERVVRWSPDARSSFQAFEDGVGDVALTSESEVMRSRMFGHDIECVVPPSTLRMDNPAVVVEANADRHGVREIAEAFLEFLVGEEAQRAFVLRGFRPVDLARAEPEPEPARREEDLWGVEALGGWPKVREELFAPRAALERARAAAREE